MIITYGLGSLALITMGLGAGMGHVHVQILRAIHEISFVDDTPDLAIVDKSGSEVSYEDNESQIKVKNR